MQELNQIELKNAVGKKIAGVEVGYDKHIIKYDDGSFSFFERYEEWGIEYQSDIKLKYEVFIEKLNVRSDGTTWFTNTQEMLIKLGILDGNKLIEDAKDKIEIFVKKCRDSERREYEKLKAKFND